ncbi:MAG TPA: LCP family protein [Gaiellaceae bacterium]|jgi:LCP family protein required for cell wall assembly
MRTTLKRGIGRGAELNGNGHAVYPPAAESPVVRYQQPPPSTRTAGGLVRRVIMIVLLVAVALALAAGGGIYLWYHQSLAAIRCHEADCKTAQKRLAPAPPPGKAAIALLIGYDYRVGDGTAAGSRSDTIMLIRADPATKTISMLSFPRDLIVPIYCKTGFVTDDRINSAYSRCGSTGTLLTVHHLTGLPISYLIKVSFHGFKEVVDQLGGVWMSVDRRYYNKNVGTAATDYANINLEPGYQLMTGGAALEFVRFRHTDSDLYRLARQQEFVRAIKQQVSDNFDPLKLPGIVSAITQNVEVAGDTSDTVVLSYARFAATLPGGHVFQDSINRNDITGYSELQASSQSIQQAVQQFVNPDVGVSKVANATALGTKVKTKTPTPQKTTVTVLNGNGVAGAAANAGYLLAQRGYLMVLPPNGLQPNAPTSPYFHTQIYYDAGQTGAKQAAAALQKLMQPADVRPLPNDAKLRALDPSSMLVVIVGQTFHNQLPPPPAAASVPVHTPANVRFDRGPGDQLLDPLVQKAPFKLEVPTVLESSSEPDTLPTDKPVRYYTIQGHNKAVYMVFRTGSNEFWGIEETNWSNPPILADRSFQHDLNGREFSFYYSGSHLQMVVLRVGDTSYWVVNTLLDSLSNETMIAIAKGLKPLTKGT